MLRIIKSLIIASIVLSLGSCMKKEQENHFISDLEYRQYVETEFEKVQELAKGRQTELFDVFNENLTLEETEALKFLYAFMPLNDLANEDGKFFLSNTKYALSTRDLFSWGKDIPEEVFRHFVLPHRINNEDVDSARAYCLKELLPRVKNLDIEGAALEVNHWCHERVNYQGTNIRTMAPLGVIKTAYGRCGEESTFTTTALRAVGIPARQVYTPRWAHTDDNHAWVEVFINGKWKYLGACEPKPELNIGWFDGPVKRAMMVHTKAYGKYKGEESILEEHEKYSILNLLENYVPVKTIYVKVIDKNNVPQSNVNVEFGLYNYAEYYPLKLEATNEFGLASLKTGYGDLRILASNSSGDFEVKNISVKETDTLILSFTKKIGGNYEFIADNIPPTKKKIPKISGDKVHNNEIRLIQEDSIRNSFIESFYSKEKATYFAESYKLNVKRFTSSMIESRGNHPEILDYFIYGVIGYDKDILLSLPEVIESKDLHDVTSNILIDHLHNYKVFSESYPDEIKKKYILNPRILNERLTSYRYFLQSEFSNLEGLSPEETVNKLTSWVHENITINNSLNYYETALSPIGVYKLKVSDEQSRDIFVVAVLRSLGIPAQIEESDLNLMYYDDNWKSISFKTQVSNNEGTRPEISFVKTIQSSDNLLYRIHFALAKFNGKQFITLEYGWEKNIQDFNSEIKVDPGYYQLTTGNRLHNGSVLVKQDFFEIQNDEATILSVQQRRNPLPLDVIATVNINEEIDDYKIFIWIDPSTEPGKHLIYDLNGAKSTFESRDIPITFYCAAEGDIDILKLKLESDFDIRLDHESEKLKQALENIKVNTDMDLPIVFLVNNKEELLFMRDGYNIGTPDQILKAIDRL